MGPPDRNGKYAVYPSAAQPVGLLPIPQIVEEVKASDWLRQQTPKAIVRFYGY
jgi:hypothetical protein